MCELCLNMYMKSGDEINRARNCWNYTNNSIYAYFYVYCISNERLAL